MKNIASLRDHALKLRRALWESMICFRVVGHDVEQNHRNVLSMVFDFLLFAARRVHRSGQMTGYEICPPPGSGPPLIHYTTFVVPIETPPASKNQLDDFRALCSCLPVARIDNYETWIKIGMTLKIIGAPLKLLRRREQQKQTKPN